MLEIQTCPRWDACTAIDLLRVYFYRIVYQWIGFRMKIPSEVKFFLVVSERASEDLVE